MKGDQLRDVLATIGRDQREVAALLGYANHNSLRQAVLGLAALPEDRAEWLAKYAKLRARLAAREAEWLAKNPPPSKRNRTS